MIALVKHVVETCFSFGRNRVYVEASVCARPMFEKLGFDVIGENLVKIGKVELLNYHIELLKASF